MRVCVCVCVCMCVTIHTHTHTEREREIHIFVCVCVRARVTCAASPVKITPGADLFELSLVRATPTFSSGLHHLAAHAGTRRVTRVLRVRKRITASGQCLSGCAGL